MNEPTLEAMEERVSILELILILMRAWKVVVVLPLIVAVGVAIVTLLLPNWYTATTRILPPQQSQSQALAILGQLGVLAGPASQALNVKNPSDVYVAMLKSRTVADELIERFDLSKVYAKEFITRVREELAGNSSITAGRDGIITIEVEDKNPQRAANMANAYVEELRKLSGQLAITEAGQRRLFFEDQLKKAKNDLAQAELELKEFTQKSGLVNPQGQIGLSVSTAAALQAQITAKEIQLAAMRTFATDDNPELKRTLRELAGLRLELAKMEKDSGTAKGDVLVPFGRAPEVGLEYIRRYREVKYSETLYEVLAKQYEIARIDESKDASVIQVLDAAVVPDLKSSPKRALITVLAGFLGLLASVIFTLTREAMKRRSEDPKVAAQLAELRALTFKR